MTTPEPLLAARAAVLHDLTSRGLAEAAYVDVLDQVISQRTWWLHEWPDGAAYVTGQVAQDLQERLHDEVGVRWPRCAACDDLDEHELRIAPELGEDPQWTCERGGFKVAAVGALS